MGTADLGSFDLIVVGAGINGAGIARDAALHGLRVLLLDKGDIGSGTTAASTRLIHGGLRYLEHAEVGLVRESLRERERLLRIAPHLVRPLPLTIPIYRGDRRGRATIAAGMLAYDLLSFGKNLPRHRMLSRSAALRREPGLAAEGLIAAAVYFDAQVEYPERLALENVLDAQRHGASVATYREVNQIQVAEGRVTGVTGQDVLLGQSFSASAPVVVNVAGPWVDNVLGGATAGTKPRLVGGTKGSHIVVGPFPGAPHDALYVEARRDGRPFFIIPWNDAYLIGTTDVHYKGNLDEVIADDWEIELLLKETNRVIPVARLTRGDVRYSHAGVRPLPYISGHAEAAITRRHLVRDHGAEGGPRGLFSIVGGKLTTYRELAEQTVDLVLKKLGRPTLASRTADLVLPGGSTTAGWPAFREEFLRSSPLPGRSSEHLLRVYGTGALDLLETASTPESRAVIDPYTGAIAAEIPWAFTREEARTLADAIARRTMIGLGPDVGVGADETSAAVARRTLGWDAGRAEDEVAAYRKWAARYRPRLLATAPTK
jgi:glycerol-3-phosphate dehydrogenase